MLKQLSIKNLAIIDDVTIDFEENLNVLTGETGAGKSIIIDAISLLFGARASSEIIAYGKESAQLHAVLYLPHDLAKEISSLCDVEIEDECIISRTITLSGRNTCKINGIIVPLFSIQEISTRIIDISGQNESQYLLNSRNHLRLLDSFIESKVPNFKHKYHESYKNYATIKAKYDQESQKNMDESTLDFLNYKYLELKDYHYSIDDEDKIIAEFKDLQSFETNANLIEEIQHYLDADDGAESKLFLALKQLGKLSSNTTFSEFHDCLNSIYIDLSDFVESFKKTCSFDQFDPKRLDFLENEITMINRLKRKYSVVDLLAHKEKLKAEIESFAQHEVLLSQLDKKMKEAKEETIIYAQEVSNTRKKYANELANIVKKELHDLYLSDALFEVNFEQMELASEGQDKVEFYMSANKGVQTRPLIKVASGGEVSRIMLGLKAVFTTMAHVDIIIFDEIDTGVSGKVALSMGKKMLNIARHCQVLAITHLPQVAAMSDQHYYIYKEIMDEKTRTVVKKLDDSGKLHEVARLLSGDHITDNFVSAAKELITSK